jgi:MoaE-MoaD fusion protein
MKIKVLFFATLKDRIKTSQIEIELAPGSTVIDLKKKLMTMYSGLGEILPKVLVSIDQNFAFPEDQIPDGAEVALFPPVSGGSGEFPTVCLVTYDVLNLDELVSKITLHSTGAVCIFTGIVRGITTRGDAHETSGLEYESYIPMAESKMGQVADEIRERWPAVEGIAIVQRIGKMTPETPTVLIACSAGHRDTGAFEAARYGIDRLKQIVPIWKKEIGPSGEVWVEGDYIPGKND